MFGLGATELLLVFVIIILFFGSKKIPELAKGIGQGINEFKKSQNDDQKDNKILMFVVNFLIGIFYIRIQRKFPRTLYDEIKQ